MDAVQNLVVHALNKIESAVDRENELLDEQIRKIGELDEDSLEAIRERRLNELKKKQVKLHELRQKGHGEYREISDTKEFFSECKQSERVVCSFFRPATWRCQVVDKHLQLLAAKHLETKFIKVDGEKNPFLSERLHITMLPSIVLIKNGKTDHTIIGFDELGGDDFTTQAMEFVLSRYGMVDGEITAPDSPTAIKSKITVQPKRSLYQKHEDDSDDDYDWN